MDTEDATCSWKHGMKFTDHRRPRLKTKFSVSVRIKNSCWTQSTVFKIKCYVTHTH